MKSRILFVVLVVLTLATIVLYPMAIRPVISASHPPDPVQLPAAHKIELVFALDTTGSMSGMIHAAREKIWSIATNLAQAESAPEIRIGLVGFRDRGDEYVTRVIDLSTDLDSVYARLMDFRADGGGDFPESVNQALDDAVQRISWSTDDNVYRAIFLVGDAPPHMDYADDVKFSASIQAASARGIVFNAIQCGQNPTTLASWKHMTSLSQGVYFNVAQNGNAVAVSTPYDKELATVSQAFDRTRLYYGSEKVRKAGEDKVEATRKLYESASLESQARRATFNNTESGRKNALGDHDLISDLNSGKVQLDKIRRDELPAAIAALSSEAQQNKLRALRTRRTELKTRMATLSSKRADYIRQTLSQRGEDASSFDTQLVATLRAQASEKGLVYKDKTVRH